MDPEVNEEKVEASEAVAPAEAAPTPQEEAGSHAANDNEVTEKKEEIIAAEVETKTVEPAAVEAQPVQVQESDNEQKTPASNSEPTAEAPASIPASEEVPPPLPASPPPTEVESASITEPQKVAEVIAQVESIPAEPKDTIDIPGIAVQPASPVPTPKVEEDVVAKIEEPVTPAPVEEPKIEDAGVPEAVEAQEPALVEEEKTEAPIQAVEPVPLIEDQVPAPPETPAQIEPVPVQTSEVKTPETQESVQASNETAQSPTVQTAVEE
ncbi:hypothetical protein B7P43_G08578 [Cryptotermes secundus]|uniref:Uncharacterized protein n=1 Tax=Cryptotermes secundus TaxID=105785 RepID=A0A2J7R4X2_9NEOP|nr:hypothetical protein B7P43_G08578 [Cryptotermes secundus]